MKRNVNVYAIYKGDKFIDVGTVEELVKRTKYTKKEIYWYATSKWWKNKFFKNKLEIFKLEE